MQRNLFLRPLPFDVRMKRGRFHRICLSLPLVQIAQLVAEAVLVV